MEFQVRLIISGGYGWGGQAPGSSEGVSSIDRGLWGTDCQVEGLFPFTKWTDFPFPPVRSKSSMQRPLWEWDSGQLVGTLLREKNFTELQWDLREKSLPFLEGDNIWWEMAEVQPD